MAKKTILKVLYGDKEEHPELGRYIKKKGRFCPFCGSDELERDVLRFVYKNPTRDTVCKTCGREWVDEYRLANFFWYSRIKKDDG